MSAISFIRAWSIKRFDYPRTPPPSVRISFFIASIRSLDGIVNIPRESNVFFIHGSSSSELAAISHQLDDSMLTLRYQYIYIYKITCSSIWGKARLVRHIWQKNSLEKLGVINRVLSQKSERPMLNNSSWAINYDLEVRLQLWYLRGRWRLQFQGGRLGEAPIPMALKLSKPK